ncbi:IclR family transcriptional regulator [Microbacterium marinilacus]|uniref:IclR family transcriptional regulator n=1 Tax=Microbacterium marinilacus TaxID=415209 RepID=A0ABP7BR09_9MICO|nr:IclR family transcriptional regulator [Microbacterium marinilacus]MBY0690259.1 IclR family transcriptional regulator [Microbacterium marinilacus]
MSEPGPRRERNPIASATRVLGALAELPEPAGVRELARLLGSPASSVQRTLEAAAESGLVRSADGRWELGWEFHRLAAVTQQRQPFRVAEPVLRALSDRTGETALLAVYDAGRGRRMFVAQAEAAGHAVRFVPELYSWLPMHAGASALAILAFLPDDERARVAADGLPPLTGTTITSALELERTLARVRDEGVAVSRDQVNLGASGVAAPLRARGGVAGSLAVIVPNQRFDDGVELVLRKAVADAAATLSALLDGPAPS